MHTRQREPPSELELTPDNLFSSCIVRNDIDMTPGKMAAQGVHAARMSLVVALQTFNVPLLIPRILESGHVDTVSMLQANYETLTKLEFVAKEQGIPCFLFYDSGHRHNDIVDGSPIVTALCLGPWRRSDIHKLTKKLPKL